MPDRTAPVPRRARPAAWGLPLGYALLYLPIALLVATSFNDSRLTTQWTGFSTRWYVTLLGDDELIAAAWLSIQVAAVSATGAAILGTACGYALARLGRFRGRPVLTGLLAAPLVLPDLLIGLALLLLFVAMQQVLGGPERGALTIAAAHVTASLSYVALIVQARLADTGRELEEAAADLGASATQAFLHVTLPMLAPAILSGWLLGFTLSLDDVVIASFVSGPGATTLPMVVFSRLRLGTTPELNALATVILGVVGLFVLAAWRLAPVAPAKPRA